MMATEQSTIPVKITEHALQELKRIQREETEPDQQWLRIGVKGGGCSGLSYVLAFDEKKEQDEVFEVDGLSCIINPAHGIYLFGMQIDWKNGLDARGFIFTNPNASATCGCGSSFAV